VTPGARGIAYSCLLDCLCAAQDHQKGFQVLKVIKYARQRDITMSSYICSSLWRLSIVDPE
jgi:pentatricopeptide repeat protein